MTEPRRILIGWEYGASGLAWCSTREELEAPYERWSHLRNARQPGGPPIRMPELTRELRADLQAWNDSWDEHDPSFEETTFTARQEQGRQLAIRVQRELGPDGWEVLYELGGRVHRVQPPGSWPTATWEEELLGYPPREQRRAEAEAAGAADPPGDPQEMGSRWSGRSTSG